MKKRSVKILSLVLALLMMFSICPMEAFAQGGNLWGWGDSQGPEMPAQQLKATDSESGVTVKVDAPEGALPAGTTLNVKAVNLQAVQDIVDADAEVDGSVVAAVDITFFYEGTEIEPEKNVSVTLSSEAIANTLRKAVLHLDASAEEVESGNVLAEIMSASVSDAESVSFDSSDFSVYVVVDTGDTGDNARVEVKFWNIEGDQDVLLADIWVKNSDSAEQIKKIVYDPGAGDLGAGEFFCGWSKTRTYDKNSTKLTIDDVRQELLDMSITEGMQPVNYYATVFKAFSVTYLDEDGAAIQTDNIIFKTGSSVSYTIDMDYTPMLQNEDFSGWNMDQAMFGSNITPSKANYKNGDSVTLTGNVIVTANAPKGYWISFEENPDGQHKGASYTAPSFCVGGTVGAAPADPELAGYDFKGWYRDKNFTQQFTFSGTISADITLYAKWELKDSVPYNVVIWTQNVGDAKDAQDSAKTYDFYRSYTLSAAPNTAISALNLSSYQSLDLEGFKYNTTKGVTPAVSSVTTVLPNGTTTVYLYYDRELLTYTFQFYDYTYTKVTDPDLSYSYSSYYYRHPNGEYTKVSRGGSYNNYYYYTPLTSFSALEHSSGVNDTYENTWYFFIAGSTTYWVYYSESAGKWVYQSSGGASGEYTQSLFSSYPANFMVDNNDTFYTRSYSQSWHDYEEMTGLYGQTLAQNGYEWPSTSGYRWFTGSSSSSGFMSYVDTFNLNSTNSSTDENETIWYGRSQSFDAQTHHFLQNEDGTWTDANLATSNLDSLQNDAADQDVWTALWNYMISYDFYGFHATKRRASVPSGGQYRVITAINNGTPTYDGGWKTTSTGWTEWLDNNVTVAIYDGSDIITPNYTSQVPTGPNGVQFLYERNTAKVNYLVGGFYTGEGIKLDNVSGTGLPHSSQTYRYQESIDGCADYEPTVPDGYIFAGWFEDASCTKPYDDTGETMPNDGVTLYAKYVQRQFRVFLRPEPDWTASNEYWQNSDIVWVDGESQARNYRIDYQDKVNDGKAIFATRPDATLLGWYRTYNNGKFSNPFIFNTAVTDSIALAYDKDAAFNVTEEDGITNKDKNRTWILPESGKLDLYAKWRKTLPGAKGITVIYDATDAGHFGTTTDTTWTDPIPYGDLAEALAQAASVANDSDNMRFAYWKLLRWNGSEFVETGLTYYPGQTFTVKKDDCRVQDLRSDSKLYTIKLEAVYVNKNAATPTHIYWYANNGTADNNGAGVRHEDKPVDINKAVNIPTPTNFTYTTGAKGEGTGLAWTDHVFLGWARLENPDNNEGVAHPELTEADLWLKWENDKYWVHGSEVGKTDDWVEAKQVAADELTPYHDMYAVWGKVFYVYHSSTGMVERRVITEKKVETVSGVATRVDNTVDLTALVPTDSLYGGYYKTYAGKVAATSASLFTGNDAVATATELNTPTIKEDTGAITYTGANVANVTWNWNDSYNADNSDAQGNAIIPVAGQTYYIKEVPASMYLLHYTHYTFKFDNGSTTDGEIKKMWMISDIDDLNYQGAGFVYLDANHTARVAAKISIATTGSSNQHTDELTVTKLFGENSEIGRNKGVTKGYLSFVSLDPTTVEGYEITGIQNYWITPDNMMVTGDYARTLTGITRTDTLEGATLTLVHSSVTPYNPS